MAVLCRPPSTLLLIGTVLSFYGSSLAASTGSESEEEPFVLSEECDTVGNFRKCWNNHFDLPSCGNERSLTVTCAERVGRSMTKCDQDRVLKYSGVVIKTVRASDNVLCDNRELHEFFKNNPYCWNAARTCARNVIFSKTYTYDCSMVREEYNECIEDMPQECIKRSKLYTKAILDVHPCAGAAIAPPVALLLFSLLVALVSRTEP